MESFEHEISASLRAIALGYPETSEGTSCVNRAFKVRRKNFLFVGEKDGEVRVMVKLTSAAAKAAADAHPRVELGRIGWATARFRPEEPLDEGVLAGWIDESYRAMAPRTVLRQLDTP